MGEWGRAVGDGGDVSVADCRERGDGPIVRRDVAVEKRQLGEGFVGVLEVGVHCGPAVRAAADEVPARVSDNMW